MAAPTSPDGGGSYELTTNNITQFDINGWQWCNTCHTGSMGNGNTNYFSCHFHGTRW